MDGNWPRSAGLPKDKATRLRSRQSAQTSAFLPNYFRKGHCLAESRGVGVLIPRIWTCRSCGLAMFFRAVQAEIDERGFYFLCVGCSFRNALVNVGCQEELALRPA